LLALGIAFATFAAGIVFAARTFPQQPYDWQYVVMSALASRKHNPGGALWFSVALGLSMLALWPVTAYLRESLAARWQVIALRVGILCGVAIGMERLVFWHVSDVVYKAHELLALGVFAGLYVGALGLYAHRLRRDRRAWLGALAIGAPLLAIGITQLALYLDQRDLGWVDHGWRAMGIAVWLSFAFWQWVAVAVLWAGLAHLVWGGEAARWR
jgi:hypothetical protein